ncbi:hypothetical protein [Archangium sp.]|uniref:hypothetical protein n=1 Tax=Archangium sp. TaxID=1872627 RepID=UPI00286A3691|nr:hypothetical protein [Archangium sp.]
MRYFRLPSLLVFLLTTVGCWESRPTLGPPGAEAGGVLSGLVIKGRVSGATVNVYRLTGTERGAQVATTTTDTEGAFFVGVGASEGPFLVVATGGSFVDEASGATIRLNSDELTALVPFFPVGTHAKGLVLTPVSHLAAGLALRQVRLGTADLGSAHDEAWLLLNAHFGGLDWRRTVPTDVTASTSSQLDAGARAGLILAGLSQQAYTAAEQAGLTPGGSVNALSLTTTLYEDLTADGYLDGLGEGGTRLLLPSTGVLLPYPLDGQTVRFTLATAIHRFLSNPRCAYRVTPADVEPLMRDLSRGSSRLFRDAGGDFDTTPPAVSVRARYRASDGSLVDASAVGTPFVRGLITLEVDAADDSTVRSLSVTQQGAALTPAPRGNTVDHFVGTWDASLAADGELVFNVVAVDGRGNSGETLFRVRVDNTPPALDVTQPVPTSYSISVRVDASALDPSSGVASFQLSGLEGFMDDADAVAAVRGTWTFPTSPLLSDGPVTFTLTACDAVTNCASRTVTFHVDRTPPVVTLWEAPPRYTKATTTSFTVQAHDVGATVSAVKARVLESTTEYMASEQAGPAGERLFRFDNLPLVNGLNTFQVWAEDSSGNSGFLSAVLVKVALDNIAPEPRADRIASYRDERGMGFAKNADGSPVLPVQYSWPTGVTAVPAEPDVYKARTRLSHGPTTPSGAELEGGNAYNVPFLMFSASRDEEKEAPIVKATYSIQVGCLGCSFPTYAGNLISSPKSDTATAVYYLPLTSETVPALANLPSSPARLTYTVTFADSLGNDSHTTTDIHFHVIGPPVSVAEDTGYATRADPQSEYHYTLGSGRYGGMWGGTGSLRVLRYVIHNPAPEPVHLGVSLSNTWWEIREDWDDIITPPTASTYTADGFSFQRTYGWVASFYMNAATYNYPCGGPAGSSATQYPRHLNGATSQFTCANLPVPGTRTLPEGQAASGGLNHAGLVGTSETTPASTWALGYMVPAQGQLALYVTRPRVPPPNAYVFHDLGNGRGTRIQVWNQDFWQWTNTAYPCGPSTNTASVFCAPYEARRLTTELTTARQSFSATLKLTTHGGATGEPMNRGTFSYSNKEFRY